ncbi:DNA packaging tegument protein UL25 [Equid gammaherpesvirus 5]|uniref:DNA packaging tegument protein UL25 n=1 Tax=Equid gammaherpesvirus 5 TaxID=10371 RepID=A0A0B4Q6A6_9GAMA|nr:DNA packaging tegument protein UL25 [Equid gammaherpesvirus 5]AIU39544.1 DNA packaging tegument protein UL25 [Equid gammaherpesvirus 5]APT43382.1 DNA packaging tegument protein UL25 [Equid gammaherpesvirus 5]
MLLARKKWPPSLAFWSPSPKLYFRVDRDSLSETRRLALRLRRSALASKAARVKAGMLRMELGNLAQLQIAHANDVLKDLARLERATALHLHNPPPPQSPPASSAPQGSPGLNLSRSNSKGDGVPGGGVNTGELLITISPEGPTFGVKEDFRTEFISGLYNRQTQWLPFYGPWYSAMTDSAMQRRVFPKELKGNVNFQNSTSLKLMTAVLDALASTTNDFYTDARNLSDVNAALCLLNGYYCLGTRAPLPGTYNDLLEDLDKKLEYLVGDLKRDASATDFSFRYSNPRQLETVAPLNRQGTYAPDFFKDHKLFAVMGDAGMFPNTKQAAAEAQSSGGRDIVYLITNAVFGQNVPPFMAYQLNLRTGLVALEVLIAVYVVLENARVQQNTVNRRLQLPALLGDQYAKRPPSSASAPKQQQSQQQQQSAASLKRGFMFSFLVKNYIVPVLTRRPHTPASSLFPGVVLLALEVADAGASAAAARGSHLTHTLINLSGKQYDKIFDLLNQKLTFKDVQGLIMAQTALRLTLENGLNLLLSKPSPLTTATDVISTQFGGGDDHDNLYFLILGCLPVPMPVV